MICLFGHGEAFAAPFPSISTSMTEVGSWNLERSG